jgi:hypothetical protein
MTVDLRKQQELEELRARLARLEAELAAEAGPGNWPPQGFYLEYYATTGFMLGIFGAMASLLVNVIGDGVMLAIGCCLYLVTGMVLGVPFFVALVRFSDGKSLLYRLAVATVLSQVLWLFNFYALLSWIQPAVTGGNWITDPAVLPPWVASVTHLVFGWTLALMYPLGRFQPYQQPTFADESAAKSEARGGSLP